MKPRRFIPGEWPVGEDGEPITPYSPLEWSSIALDDVTQPPNQRLATNRIGGGKSIGSLIVVGRDGQPSFELPEASDGQPSFELPEASGQLVLSIPASGPQRTYRQVMLCAMGADADLTTSLTPAVSLTPAMWPDSNLAGWTPVNVIRDGWLSVVRDIRPNCTP